jgi:hypothetical protein
MRRKDEDIGLEAFRDWDGRIGLAKFTGVNSWFS